MKKVILVTGASSGIGKSTALQLINDGHIVYGAARRIEKMKDLQEQGGHAIQMDVTKEADVKACVEQIMKEQDRIDVLVNNAGYAVYGPVENVSLADAKRQFEVNIFGLAAITKEVIPQMRAQKSGTIINISSVGGKVYTPFGAWYHATKHALEGWSDCLRLELSDFGINVVIIEPGIIKTEFADVMYDPMLERAKGTVYEKNIASLAEATKGAYEKPGQYSEPSVIAKAISKSIRAKRPKTRYAAGKLAKPLIFLRALISDRWFDKAVMSQVESAKA